jgi:Family of unknown function (DUF6275)
MSENETAYTPGTFPDPDRYLTQAKQLVMDNYNGHYEGEDTPPLILGDLYIVSFTKTLTHWRAQVASTVVRGMMWIVTCNGIKSEAYIEVYRKINNVKVSTRRGPRESESQERTEE